MSWARHRYEPDFAAWLGVVLLHGGGFDGPAWSVPMSLANLDDDCYLEVGAAVARVFDGYVEQWRDHCGTRPARLRTVLGKYRTGGQKAE